MKKTISTEKEAFQTPAWSCGLLDTPVGPVYKVSTAWMKTDYWGQIKARTTAFRMHYTIPPGLYAVGNPDESSDVLVSANYKLSFDILRRELKELNAWILVLDTAGINVWCAAGKGTFGTAELIRRIQRSQLDQIVKHRRIIIPQLGAPGVNAAVVQKRTQFKVLFGPVYARDISEFIRNDYNAIPEMRRIRFTLWDRLILTPMELNPALKQYPLFVGIVLLISGLQPPGILFREAWFGGVPLLVLGLGAIFAGAFLTPVLLPWIPSHSFAVKGWLIGILVTLGMARFTEICRITSIPLIFLVYLLFPLLSSYLALQFTGATPFTSISGVKKELKLGIPIYIGGAALSIILLLIYKLTEWGVL